MLYFSPGYPWKIIAIVQYRPSSKVFIEYTGTIVCPLACPLRSEKTCSNRNEVRLFCCQQAWTRNTKTIKCMISWNRKPLKCGHWGVESTNLDYLTRLRWDYFVQISFNIIFLFSLSLCLENFFQRFTVENFFVNAYWIRSSFLQAY